MTALAQKHFRVVASLVGPASGQVHLRSVVGGERVLLVQALKWGEVARIGGKDSLAYNEWFIRGSVALTDQPEFTFGHVPHGGTVIGQTLGMYDNDEGLFAYVEVDEGDHGDWVLERVDRGTRLATSIGFHGKPNGFRIYDGHTPGVRREAVSLFEIAIVAEGAYASSRVIGRRPRPSNTELASLATARLGVGA